MKNNTIIIAIVTAVIVGGGAFFGGIKYQQMQQPSFGNRQFMMSGPNGQMGQGRGGNFQGSRPVSGEIISQDDTSVTIKMEDGSSRIVILSDKTTINKASEGSKSDLTSGEHIVAFGTENSDGSITAQNVSIGGNMMMRGGYQPSTEQRN